MKKLFTLCLAVPLVMLLQTAHAQDPIPRVTFTLADEATVRAMIERSNARSKQCFLLRKQAVAALKKNDVHKAETLFKQALSFDPDDGESRVRLAAIHIRAKQSSAVVADLEPVVNPNFGSINSLGSEITTRMLYVLAQLDSGNWEAAAKCYQKGYRPDQKWSLPGGGPDHTFPDLQFSPDNPDVLGLRAQAHLMLGACVPHFTEEKDQPAYMLEHLRQVLKMNPKSLDASYLSGFMLAKMDRFPEARAAYEKALRLAGKDARPEIQKALDTLKVAEEEKRVSNARIKTQNSGL